MDNNDSMALPPIVSREEWSRARQRLLVQEKAVMRLKDLVSAQRRTASAPTGTHTDPLTSPSHDQCGMRRPSGTSSAERWYLDIVVVVAQTK